MVHNGLPESEAPVLDVSERPAPGSPSASTPWTRSATARLAVIGLVAGAASGLFGIGGGLVMVPAMVMFASMRQHEAHASSLGAVVPIATVASIPFIATGFVSWPFAAAMAVTAMIGARTGARVMHRMSERQLRWAFIALMAVVAIRMLLGTDESTAAPPDLSTLLFLIPAFGIGLLAGIASALFGIGGGLVMVPLMVLTGLPQHLAQGTSLVAIVPTAIVGARAHQQRGFLDLRTVVPLAAGGLIGGFAASLVALELDPVILQRGLAILLAVAMIQLARRPG